MNKTLIFKENNKLYICERASFVTDGFQYPEIWEECKAPAGLKNTIPGGAAVINEHNGKLYMLYNTDSEALGKWFVYVSEGIRFERPEKIPEGTKEGFTFINDAFPGRKVTTRRHNFDDGVSVYAEYGKLCADDFTAKKNPFAEKLEHYEEMKKFFALDLYDTINFHVFIKKGALHYKKYSNLETEININDILDDLSGNWKYTGGIGVGEEFIFSDQSQSELLGN